MQTLTHIIETSLAPLDLARVRFLHLFKPLTKKMATHREARVALQGILIVFFSGIASFLFPIPLIAIGTLAFGVPHVLADLRYLVFQGPASGKGRRYGILGLAILLSFILPSVQGLAAGIFILGVFGFSRSCCLITAGILGLFSWNLGLTADWTLLYIHPIIAILFWCLWRQREDRWHWGPLLLIAIMGILIFSVDIPQMDKSFQNLSPALLIPELSLSPISGMKWISFYAFVQSVHYGLWLRLIPEEARDQVTPRSFKASFRSLLDDCGWMVLVGCAIVLMAVIMAGVVDMATARFRYLQLASFHVFLEIFILMTGGLRAHR